MAISISATHRYATPPLNSALVDPATPAGQQPLGQTGWTLVLSEEFDDPLVVDDAVNGLLHFHEGGTQWSAWYPDWPMFEVETGGNHSNTNQGAYYTLDKVSVSGGALQLACDKEVTYPGLAYTAGTIQTHPFFNQEFGFFEAKLKIDTNTLSTHWPAWWMSSSDYNTWPPEIDIWEYWEAQGYQTNVWTPANTDNGPKWTGLDHTVYHTFGCEWTASGVSFYTDGSLTRNTALTPTGHQYLILNNGVWGNAGTFASCGLSVDYVRVWQ